MEYKIVFLITLFQFEIHVSEIPLSQSIIFCPSSSFFRCIPNVGNFLRSLIANVELKSGCSHTISSSQARRKFTFGSYDETESSSSGILCSLDCNRVIGFVVVGIALEDIDVPVLPRPFVDH